MHVVLPGLPSEMAVLLPAPSTDLPLTLRNVVKAVERVKWKDGKKGRWGRVPSHGLGDYLCVPCSKLCEIERRHSSTVDRKTAVIEYWLLTDPTPSWRRLIYVLDKLGEHEVAGMVQQYAEPLTGTE